MSNYQNRIDFISRTRQILIQYEHNCNYQYFGKNLPR